MDIKRELPHYCIGVTFTGEYREDIIEPVCNRLLEFGMRREDIFYDKWHEVLINGPHGW